MHNSRAAAVLILIALCLCALVAPPVLATQDAAISNAEWAELMKDAKFKQADQELGKVYKEALNFLSEDDRSAFRDEQRAWVGQRDKEAFAKYAKGTPEYVRLLTELTSARTAQINRTYLGRGVKADGYSRNDADGAQQQMDEKIPAASAPARASAPESKARGASAEAAEGRLSEFAKTRKRAEQGDAAAQNDLGIMYYRGRGTARDDARAVEWYQKSAEQGNAWGQYNLAYMYQEGRGLAKDESKAAYWYQKSAEQGNTKAQVNLGILYEEGRGIGKDEDKALEWYKKAANLGDAVAKELADNLSGIWNCDKFRITMTSRDRKSGKYHIVLTIPSARSVAKVILDDEFEIPTFQENSRRAFYFMQGDDFLHLDNVNRIPNKIIVQQPSGKTCGFTQDRSY